MATLKQSNPRALGDLPDKISGFKLKVGFLRGATYPDGTSVPSVAAWNEFGVPSHNQPPRPFFRRMIAEQSSKWPKIAAATLKSNGMDVKATLDLLGQEIQGRVKESITKLVDPPLAQSTIDRKGFDKPLIEHAIMLNAVSYEITES